MKIILISNKIDKVRTLSLNSWAKCALSVLLLGIPVTAGTMLGIKIADGRWELLFDNSIVQMQNQIELQREEVDAGRQQLDSSLSGMTLKLAKMRSRLVRLDALGEQLTQIASLEDGEFDFSSTPGLGGPIQTPLIEIANHAEIEEKVSTMFAKLDDSISSRESQLQILQSMLSDKKLKSERMVAGRPVKKGWLSSEYGMRIDPFHGKQQWHAGIDFAGRDGDDVIAVASGIVTWSGDRNGYGKMVEISHSDGYITRYAHNQENIANLGAIVQKGDVVAQMGSSGRSTGPHVHFEVFKNGRTVDPASYIHRTYR
ncbi:MAG: M23 family metallopeptidase [Porticoccaceae bacterium]|jgi:murein DD-endopeptidase MepM/ murein hydrolase activator NlpD|nr:M23 family metallopeptidase [Porticoccaceae bacterium]MBT4210332.1 M23 family metallopeptidase [Porticoccaceae bacterium]MBT4591794.1 M23 family metallopeptidase [Porticoccaceae bacterium]MBT5004725.1 M23 family metallopeptidase [Porticoccaceae bacterium]MBT5104406.1 M23 family metallopeptidase [Porticoccaceae bacterium]